MPIDSIQQPQQAEEVQTAAQRMTGYKPVPWDQLPDLGLYMDQVITFLERQLAPLYPAGRLGEKVLTSAMINNYVKMHVIPRPKGKKYEREHLAALLMIYAFKQVLPIDEAARLIPAEAGVLRAGYEAFCAQQERALHRVAQSLTAGEDTVMACAVEAVAYCLAAKALLAGQEDADGVRKKGE